MDGSSGASGNPPVPSEELCGTRPHGWPRDEHVHRLESAEGDVLHLGRSVEGPGVGESVIFRLESMGLRIDGQEICVSDPEALEYENTHHNWNDVARATKDGLTYELAMVWDAVETLTVFGADGAVVRGPTPLVWTGTPPFCTGCMRPLWLGISEVIVHNDGFPDEASEFEPLVEIYNASSEPIDLEGWTLSDDLTDRRKWTFPAVTIGRHETVVVFADGEVDQGPLHASFTLSAGGGQLVLTAPDGSTDGGLVYGPQNPGKSLAYSWSAGAHGGYVVAAPTPGDGPSQ